MSEPRLPLGFERRLQSGGLAWRYADCAGKFQEGAGTQSDLPATMHRNNQGNGAIRPLNWQPNEPSTWMLGINVLPPILATDGAHHRQAHAS